MAQTIRVRCTVESDTLKLPELSALVGKKVEIIVIEDEAESGAKPVEERKRPVLGSLRGLMEIPDSFDDPLPPEVLRAFEGNDEA